MIGPIYYIIQCSINFLLPTQICLTVILKVHIERILINILSYLLVYNIYSKKLITSSLLGVVDREGEFSAEDKISGLNPQSIGEELSELLVSLGDETSWFIFAEVQGNVFKSYVACATTGIKCPM